MEDIIEALWDSRVSSATISKLNEKTYVHVCGWHCLRRNWCREYENVAIWVAISVNEDGYREVLGAAEGMKQDQLGWFLSIAPWP